MLNCATNPRQCLVAGPAVGWTTDRYFSASRALLVLVDCGGASAGCDSSGARFRWSRTRWSNAVAACQSLAGILAGISLRDCLVCRDLLLDFRHHASVWRDACSGGGAGAFPVLLVCRTLSRDVWPAAGLGCGKQRVASQDFGDVGVD